MKNLTMYEDRFCFRLSRLTKTALEQFAILENKHAATLIRECLTHYLAFKNHHHPKEQI